MTYSGLVYFSVSYNYNRYASATIPVVTGDIVYATCGYNNAQGTLDTWQPNPNAATTITPRRPLIYGGANKLFSREFNFEGLEGSRDYKKAIEATSDFKVLVSLMGSIMVLAYDKPTYAVQNWAMNTSAIATVEPSVWIGQVGVLAFVETNGRKCSFKLTPLVDLSEG